MESQRNLLGQPILFGLSLAAGGGIVLMIIGLGVGVVNAEAASNGLVSTLFIAGLLLLITGVAAWAAVTRPFEHFDDITQPKDSGHGHHEAHHDADEAVLLPDGMTDVLSAGETPAALPAGHSH